MTRIESPSSVNTYRACQRKYFYHYKLNLPTKESVAALTGKAVHAAIENFFAFNASCLNFTNYEQELRNHLLNSFNHAWIKEVPKLGRLEIDKEIIRGYYKDSLMMLEKFSLRFLQQLNQEMKTKELQEAFLTLAPETEVAILSETYRLRGYIDAIHRLHGEARIVDYKTSRKDDITEEYRLQLAVYTLLFKERHGKLPDKAGVYFLRHGSQKFLEVNEELLNFARQACEEVHMNTVSDNIRQYPKNLGPGCKWCDYKDICFGQKTILEFQNEANKNDK